MCLSLRALVETHFPLQILLFPDRLGPVLLCGYAEHTLELILTQVRLHVASTTHTHMQYIHNIVIIVSLFQSKFRKRKNVK